MKVFIAGQKYFGRLVYEAVRGMGLDVIGVCSPAFRDERLRAFVGGPEDRPDRLRDVADRDGVPWMEAGNLRAETLPGGVDLIIAAHSFDFIGRPTRDKCKLGAIGYHPSLLPLHRGRDAVRWTIRMGDRIAGGTVYWLNDTVDGGPVAAQDWCFVRPGWDAQKLWRNELQPMGVRLIAQTLADVRRGLLVRIPQDAALASWEPSINQPPLYRPELLQIGGAWEGYKVITERWATMTGQTPVLVDGAS